MLCLWFPKADQTRGENFNELLITIIAASFILALVFCVFYYVVWHPKAKIKKMGSKTKLKPKEESISMIQLGKLRFLMNNLIVKKNKTEIDNIARPSIQLSAARCRRNSAYEP